jgi:phosphoglycolate phosphatase-like HAD superfamily hydrolase
MSPVIVLWDLDYTLLHTGGVDQQIWSSVCAELLGVPDRSPTVVPGSTAPQLLHDIMVQFGAAPERAEELLAEALRREVSELRSRRNLLRRRGSAMPGARAALDAVAALATERDVVQSVLTGNQRSGAHIKLDAFGLTDGLDLPVGAYGTDHRERPRLVSVAQERVRSTYGDGYSDATTILVGDSLLDIAAAHHAGARVVAVATGSLGAAELARAGADAVLPDLRDTLAVTATILGLAA